MSPIPRIISLDQGTSSTRAIVFNLDGTIVGSHQIEHEQITLHSGWLEHDPNTIIENSIQCIVKCIIDATTNHGVDVEDIKAIGITNQRETTVVWDKNTGEPLYNAIVWSDARTHDTCNELRANYDADRIAKLSGLRISPYFSAVKIKWMIDNVPEVKEAVEKGTALFGTIDSWLVWKLSKERNYVTDVTNAGRTMLMNISTLRWEPELVGMIGIDKSMLPDIKSCSEVFGHLDIPDVGAIPITGLIGDQQAALVGQTCFEFGQGKNTYGTGCFLIINTGTTPHFSSKGLLTTPAYKFGDDACVYALEGSIANCGAAVEWLRTRLGIINSISEVEELALSVPDVGDVYFNPAFNGILAPLWREDARGVICGLTHSSSKAHICRATLESIAFRVNSILETAAEDMGRPIEQLRVDGGGTVNRLLMQTQADIINAPVYKPVMTETTALGAAFAAGKTIGLYESESDMVRSWQLDMVFRPRISQEQREQRVARWDLCVEKALGWVEDENGQGEKDWSLVKMAGSMGVGMVMGVLGTMVVCKMGK